MFDADWLLANRSFPNGIPNYKSISYHGADQDSVGINGTSLVAHIGVLLP